MFKHPRPLDTQTDCGLRLQPNQPYHFAAAEMLVPIVAGEAARVARDYPILFARTTEAPPFALLGLREGQNTYVQPSGHWTARYIPAQVRCYPFLLAKNATSNPDAPEEQTSFTLLIDADAPHLSQSQGAPLFTPNGEPTEVLDRVRQILAMLEQDVRHTRRLVAEIDSAGLLVDQHLEIRPKSGEPSGLDGFRVIDTARLAACPADTLVSLHRSGALSLIHAHLISLTNVQDGPLASASATPPPAPDVFTSDTLSFEGIDWQNLH